MSVFENDWIMRQIHSMSDMLGKLLLHRTSEKTVTVDELHDEEVKKYYQRIRELIAEKQYEEAMRYLREHFALGNMEYLSVALACFDELNALDAKELAAGNYSRNALYNDVSFISEKFGIQL